MNLLTALSEVLMIPTKPTNSHWTDEQWRSIYLRGKNILISAGAGSGKTAVLTERVFQLINEGVDVNQLLVVTFTKAAALEMKERIRNRIIKGISEGNDALFPQLNLLESAQISTFDSFSMAVVKKYGYLLNIDSDIQIGDAVELKKLKDDLLDTFINEKHVSQDAAFIDFVKRYSLRDGRAIRLMLDQLTENLLQRPDFESVLKNDLEAFHTDEFYDALIQKVVRWIIDKVWDIRQYLKIIQKRFDFHAVRSHVADLEMSYGALLSSSDYETLRIAILNHKAPNLPSRIFDEEEEDLKNSLNKYKEKIKKIFDEIKKLVRHDRKTIIEIMKDNYPHELTMLSLAGEFIHRFFEHQIKMKYFDYSSIATLSIRLITQFPEVKRALQAQFKEILVDEYQDTSPLQDTLIEGISNQNLYVVGDIKQSIYRFRGAEPKIFQEKYRKYLTDEASEVIHLNANFRSREEVIDDINDVFERIFDETFGGVDYRDNHQMNFGLEPYIEEAIFNQNYGLTVVRYDNELSKYYENIEEKSKDKRDQASLEAQLFIKDILDKKKDYKIFDKDSNSLRPARFDDFVILIDRKTYFDEFKDAFQSYNVPLHIHKSDTFLSNIDVLVTINLFKLLLSLSDKAVCEEHFKQSFLSLAYSYLFDFTTEEIIDFYSRIEAFEPEVIFNLSKGSVFEPLFKVFAGLLDQKEYLTLHDILMHFHMEFNLVENALKLDFVSAVEERSIYIFEQLKSFDKKMFNLADLIEYFTYAMNNHRPNNWFFSIDIDYVRGTAVVKDKVNLMTIHKSKGLEFPIVYLPNTFASWRGGSEGARFSDDYGLLINAYHDGLITPLAGFIDDKINDKESLSEHLRLLYVALTRAREAIIVAHPRNKWTLPEEFTLDEDDTVYNVLRWMYNSYFDIIQSVIFPFNEKIKEIDLNHFDFKARTTRVKREPLVNQPYDGDLIQYRVLDSQTESAIQVEDETIRFVQSGDVEKMQLGSDVHETLKNLDFSQDITDQLKKMNIKASHQNLIEAFFDQPIMQRRSQGRVYKELPFVNPQEDTIIRGVIDLVIEYEEEVVIIDYKMRSVSESSYQDQVLRYVKYLHHKTKKPVSGYLYSLVNATLNPVIENFKF